MLQGSVRDQTFEISGDQTADIQIIGPFDIAIAVVAFALIGWGLVLAGRRMRRRTLGRLVAQAGEQRGCPVAARAARTAHRRRCRRGRFGDERSFRRAVGGVLALRRAPWRRAGVAAAAAAAPREQSAAQPPVPVFAYYYIWFDPTSWDRAKRDLPLAGKYSSNSATVMRRHIEWAKRAGITGFIVSWKHNPSLDRRLATLISVAESEHFSLAMIYQGLDFYRHAVPAEQVGADLQFFARTYARREPFKVFAKPLVIWSGTWEFHARDVKRMTDPVRDRLTVLASERNVSGYERLVDAVDGDAYYWSSVNPDTYPGLRREARRNGTGGPRPPRDLDRPCGAGLRRTRDRRDDDRVAQGRSHAAAGVRRGVQLVARRDRSHQLERVQRELIHRAERPLRDALSRRGRTVHCHGRAGRPRRGVRRG